MALLPGSELDTLRTRIQSAGNSYELTEAVGGVLVHIANQTSGMVTGLAATTETLRDTIGELADRTESQATTLSTALTSGATIMRNDNAALRDHVAIQATRLSAGLGAISTTLNNNNASICDQIQDQVAALSTSLTTISSELHQHLSAISGNLFNIAQRGCREQPLHVDLEGAPIRMIVELQSETFNELGGVLQELKKVMRECCADVVQCIGHQTTHNANLVDTLARIEKGLAEYHAGAVLPARKRGA